MREYNFAFFGTPYVARDTLELLHENGYAPSMVVSNPDAPRGRKHVMTPTETKELAIKYNLPVLTPEKLDDEAIEKILEYKCDYAIVVAYGKILPERLIHSFPKGVINIHYSLLPKYRGASPVESALLNGETVTGVTIQQMVKKLDAGDIIAAEEVPILPGETTKELRPRLVKIGAELLVKILPLYEKGKLTPIEQAHDKATHVGKLQKEDGLLDLSDTSGINWRKYRAFTEGPGTYFMDEGKRVKITNAELAEDGQLRILRVIPEGKKEIDFTRFLQQN